MKHGGRTEQERVRRQIERLGIEGIPADEGPLPQLTLETVREWAQFIADAAPRPRRARRPGPRLVFPRRSCGRRMPAA